VIAKEIEGFGIPTAHVCTMTPIALMVGSNRVIPACGIAHPLGNPDLDPDSERMLRKSVLEKALQALKEEIKEQKLFRSSM
jgi:betaine reductase